MEQENYPLAAILALASALLFATMGGLIKHLSGQVPNELVVFFRNLFGLAALMPWLWHRGLGALRTRELRLHLLRGAVGLTAMYCYFYALGHMPLAEAVLLNYAAPLYIPFLASAWLGEGVPKILRLAVVVGFVGIALILKPSTGLFEPVAVVGLCAGFFTAGAFVTLRRLSASEPAARTVFYFAVFATLVSAVPLSWSWRTPSPDAWLTLVLAGVCATGAQLLLTRSYAFAPAARIGPFSYATVVFAALLGWAAWGEVPDRYAFMGGGLVIAAGVLALRVQRRPRH